MQGVFAYRLSTDTCYACDFYWIIVIDLYFYFYKRYNLQVLNNRANISQKHIGFNKNYFLKYLLKNY